MATYGFDENKNLIEIETGGESEYPLKPGSTNYYISSVNRTTSTFNNGTLIAYTCSLTTSYTTINPEQFISDIKNNKTYLVTVSGTGGNLNLSKVPVSCGYIGTTAHLLSGIASFGYDLIIFNMMVSTTNVYLSYWCLTDAFPLNFSSVTFYIYQE